MSLQTTQHLIKALYTHFKNLDEDQKGVAMTEYVIVFSLITIGGTISCLSVAFYVKAYRDFLIWWMTHPAV